MAKLLVVDDEPNIRSSLKNALERRGHEVVTAEDFARGRSFSEGTFDIIFLDVKLPDGNGLDLLREILARDPEQTVVMISGHADIDMAVTAIKTGAYDFIEKPISLDRLLITIDNALRTARLVAEKKRLTSLVYGEFIGKSPSIEKLRRDVEISARKTDHFLILGENGTGKELVAHMIHNHSRMSGGPFVAVNCAALPKELVESELFGHVKGAFTGALRSRNGHFVEADGGSIFLDEISEMPIAAQAKILRVVENREITPVGGSKTEKVTCNIIAASNRNLEELVAAGRFRQDLLYRLNVVQLQLPPLRQRPGDLALLAEYFLRKFEYETGAVTRELSDGALKHLAQYPFPGNVRELKNLMERVNIYCNKTVVEKDDISALMPPPTSGAVTSLKDAVSRFEYDYIKKSLARNNDNVAETARQLGLERSHLYKKLRKYEDR